MKTYSSRRCGNPLFKYIVIGFIAIFALFFLTFAAWSASRRTETALVKRAERVMTRTSSSYMLFTDKGEYVIEDSLWLFRWNSSSVYGSVEESKTYELDVIGWRIPLFSMYPNVISATEAKSK